MEILFEQQQKLQRAKDEICSLKCQFEESPHFGAHANLSPISTISFLILFIYILELVLSQGLDINPILV